MWQLTASCSTDGTTDIDRGGDGDTVHVHIIGWYKEAVAS